jgi:hypothetical protein
MAHEGESVVIRIPNPTLLKPTDVLTSTVRIHVVAANEGSVAAVCLENVILVYPANNTAILIPQRFQCHGGTSSLGAGRTDAPWSHTG